MSSTNDTNTTFNIQTCTDLSLCRRVYSRLLNLWKPVRDEVISTTSKIRAVTSVYIKSNIEDGMDFDRMGAFETGSAQYPEFNIQTCTDLSLCRREYSRLLNLWESVRDEVISTTSKIWIITSVYIKFNIEDRLCFVPDRMRAFETCSAQYPEFSFSVDFLAKEVKRVVILEDRITQLALKCCELNDNVYPIGIRHISISLKVSYSDLTQELQKMKEAIESEKIKHSRYEKIFHGDRVVLYRLSKSDPDYEKCIKRNSFIYH